MPAISTRFPVPFGDVFPQGVFILGVEASHEFSARGVTHSYHATGMRAPADAKGGRQSSSESSGKTA